MTESPFRAAYWYWPSKTSDTRVGRIRVDEAVPLSDLVEHVKLTVPSVSFRDVMVAPTKLTWEAAVSPRKVEKRRVKRLSSEERRERWEREKVAELVGKYPEIASEVSMTAMVGSAKRGDEFLRMSTVWLRRRRGFGDIQRVLNVDPDTDWEMEDTDHWREYGLIRFTYLDRDGVERQSSHPIGFARYLQELEKLARWEERRRPRMLMYARLQRAVREMPGRSDMVYRTLKDVTFPDPNDPEGKEMRVEPNRTVTYLPPQSLEWLIRDGYVKPLCLSGESAEDCPCEWHRLAALTRDDTEFLALYGWKNPFDE